MGIQKTDDVEPIYDGKLDFDNLMENPILKPVAQMNDLFVNNELTVNKALWEYEEKNKIVNKMLEDVPKYKETNFINLIENMLREMKTIVFAQDRQKDAMKKAIKEMIDICKSHYKPIVGNFYDGAGKGAGKTLPTGSISTETKLPEEKDFESSLVEKNIPKPKEKIKKREEEEFIPLE